MPTHPLMAISAAGLDVERTRIDVASLNLAYANVALGADGQGWRPLRVVPAAGEGTFAAWLGMPQVAVQPVDQGVRRVREPGHPLADAHGDVRYPAVDPMREMLALQAAARAYEANLAALQTTRAMLLKALEIGRQP